ncbi:MAG TPA: type II toxin-antitoxin system RelE/ParE family toxin [Candidatus Saccharimonadales bacterium]|nr:type II toxin-antitoxin system RelE/ParE family toxin [Candidatus Saccharimonadales bacterium]
MADSIYTIEYKKSVEKELRKLPLTQLKGVIAKICALATNPYPEGSVKLRGSSNLFRIRHADYRIIYRVHDEKLVILVVKVGHRREVYRKF